MSSDGHLARAALDGLEQLARSRPTGCRRRARRAAGRVGLVASASAISSSRCLPYGSWRVTQSRVGVELQRFEQARAPRRQRRACATRRDASQRRTRPARSQIASATDSSTVRPRKQRVDLERARQAALDARVRRQCGDALAAQDHVARVGAQHAGEQVDERRLAGAVRTDQRVPRAGARISSDTSSTATKPRSCAAAARSSARMRHRPALRAMPSLQRDRARP